MCEDCALMDRAEAEARKAGGLPWRPGAPVAGAQK